MAGLTLLTTEAVPRRRQTTSRLIEPKATDSGQTLITALLVFYPVAASVAAIIAGIYLLGGPGPV